MIDAIWFCLQLRKFFDGTGAVTSIFDDITSKDSVVTVVLNGKCAVPDDVLADLLGMAPEGVTVEFKACGPLM